MNSNRATTESLWTALDVIQIEVEANRRGQVTEHQLALFKSFQSESKSNGWWFFVPFGVLMICGLTSLLCTPTLRGSKDAMLVMLAGIGALIFLIWIFAIQQNQMDTDLKTLSVATVDDKLKVWLLRPSGRESIFHGNRYYVDVSGIKREISEQVYDLFKTREHELFRVYYLANSKWLLSLEPVSEIPQAS